MPDLGPAVGAFLELLSPILGPVVKAFFRTTFGMVFLVLCCLGISVTLAAHGSVLRGVIAGVGCAALGAFVTFFLALKNAVLRGLVAAVERVTFGARAVKLIFSKLGIDDASESHGGLLGTAERMPLRQAEEKVRGVVMGLLNERAQKSGLRAWLARKIMASVLDRVETLTLARFRSEDAAKGGVDLRVVRDELGASVDGLIARQVTAQANRLTAMVAIAYSVATVLIGIGVARLNI
jgi:hypothetical protein